MKARNIIHELTINQYEQCGVITVERGDNPFNAFCTAFGSGIETVYSHDSTAKIVQKGTEDFLYIYNSKFPERDSDLFAILKDDNNEIIYIYKIE